MFSNNNNNLFKRLHPGRQINLKTNEWYRVISQTSAYPKKQQKEGSFKLDIVAIEQGEKVKRERQGAYLFTTRKSMEGAEKKEQVTINSHGGFSSLVHDEVILTPEMPMVVFLGPHKKYLVFSIIPPKVPFAEFFFTELASVPYAEVCAKGITLVSKQAKDDFDALGYPIITGTSTLGAICNYSLSKFKLSEEELLPQQGKHYFDYIVARMYLDRESKKEQRTTDMIVLRKKGPRLSARDMIKIAQEEGYTKVIFNCCRSDGQRQKLLPSFAAIFQDKVNQGLAFIAFILYLLSRLDVNAMLSPMAMFMVEVLFARAITYNDYFPSRTRLLETPLFYSWDEIKQEEKAKLNCAPRATR